MPSQKTFQRGPATLSFLEHDAGCGRWVTLINGFARPARDFAAWMKHLGNQQWSSCAPDNRGSGQSPGDQPFSLDDLADDVTALWDHLGVGTSAVVGISMGGMVGQRMAQRWPSRVTALVLVSTTNDARFLRSMPPPWEANDLDEATRRIASYVAPSFAAGHEQLLKAMARTMLETAAQTGFLTGARRQREAVNRHPFPKDAIACPTLIVHGELDQVVDPASVESLLSMISSARAETLPEAGHMLLVESRERLFALIDDFLRASCPPRT